MFWKDHVGRGVEMDCGRCREATRRPERPQERDDGGQDCSGNTGGGEK